MSSVELPDDNEKSPSSASTSPCPSPVGGKHKPHRLLPTNLYVVLYNFKSRHQDELDLKAGYKVTVIDTSDPDWWKGKCLGRVGYFPSKYCSKLSPGEKPLQVTHNLQVSDGDNGLMLLRDQIVIQIGEELDGMVMIRSGDNRQGVCPVKFLQEVWQRSEAACQVNQVCTCNQHHHQQKQQRSHHNDISTKNKSTSTQHDAGKTLQKIYYPYPQLPDYSPKPTLQMPPRSKKNNKNKAKTNSTTVKNNSKPPKKNKNFFQFYNNSFNFSNIGNFNNNSSSNNSDFYKNNTYLAKQNNLNNINKIFVNQLNASEDSPRRLPSYKNGYKNGAVCNSGKAPFSSTKRPLSMRLTSPKNFFTRKFRSDSQKRPLLLEAYSCASSTSNLLNDNEQELEHEHEMVPPYTEDGDNYLEDDQRGSLKIVPASRHGLRIYTISENVERFAFKSTFYRSKNLYISSNSRPLFVRK